MFCFLCDSGKPSLPGGLHELQLHFMVEHNFQFTGGNSKGFFVCKENNCSRSFTLFSSFSRHVNSTHFESLIHPSFQSNPQINVDQSVEDVEMVVDSENSEELPVNINQNEEMTFEVGRGLINQIICELRCKTSIPEKVVSVFVSAMIKIAIIISIFVQGQFLNLLRTMNIDVNSAPIRVFLNSLDIASFFKNTSSFAKQIKYNLQNLDYNAPQEIFLGQRVDTVIKDDLNTTKIVKETYQYFSIIRTLQSILKFTNIRDIIIKEPQLSDVEIYGSYKDGTEFSSHEFFQKHPNAFRINLYYDDVEVANPIGSQSAVYKIAAFYFTIQNAGFFNSKLDNIFILAIAYNTDLKKYGFNKVLRPFVEEMKTLESETGIEIFLNGEVHTLRATLVSFSGDSLAAHDILGFSSPASTRFCRQCLITRKKFHENPIFRADSRTETKHTLQLKHLQATDFSPKTSKLYGVKQDSPLNELNYFHVTNNCTFDPMHDLLEGVVPMTIKQILKYFVLDQKLFSVFEFNERIDRFRYGVTETKNRPAANFTNEMLNSSSNKLKQKSTQCWLLLRVFPFLIGHFLTELDLVYLGLTAKLVKICSIVFSAEVNFHSTCDLHETVIRFLLQFDHLFGDKIGPNKVLIKGKKMINKGHHLLHYSENILLKGPTAQYSCMRFESKHFPIKQQIASAHNFVNVPKSIAKRQSLLQSFNIKYNSFRNHIPMLNSFKIVQVSTLSCANVITSTFGQIDFIKQISGCTVNNCKFRPNYVLRIKDVSDSTFPNHVIIQHIFEFGSRIYFHCKQLHTVDIDEISYAFEVEETADDILIDEKSLVDYYPRNIWQNYADNKKFVSIKYSF
jgi:hypothetical protein